VAKSRLDSAWATVKSFLPKHPDTKGSRYDFLENPFLGYGTSRDKLSYSSFTSAYALTDVELDALYYSDDVASRIVNLRPAEMLRAGYTLCSKTEPERARELQKMGQSIDLDIAILRGMQWGRLRGGAVCMFGALDGEKDLSKPLRVEKVKSVAYLNVIDRRYASVRTWQEDPFTPGYGSPEIYTLGTLRASIDVHTSRLIKFDGVQETDPVMRRQLGGWTPSCLQRCYDVLRKFATVYESAAQLMADASQGVWKIENLLDAIANNKAELIARMQLADMTRSAGRAIMVDSETEDFTRVATPLTGVEVILDRFQQRLAACAEMPVTLLMGRSPGGMNATGDSDFRAWYGAVKSGQTNELEPVLRRAYNILAAGNTPEDLEITFNPLWEQTAEERARTENMLAQTDKIYTIDIGACSPEQVAIARFGSGKGQIEVDEEQLRTSLDIEGDFTKKLEAARDKLTDKELAALSIAQGVSPIIVSSLINAQGKTEEAPLGGPPGKPDADKKAKPEDK
jgi:phage-related protein (TIGR01555 family)